MSSDGLTIAILEDSDSDYDLIVDYLARQGFRFNVIRIQDKSGFDEFLSGREPDLIISDFNLPGFNALDALTKTREKWKDSPFIIISGTLREESLVDLFRNGATDFILKDKSFRLGPSITRSLEDRLQKRALAVAEAKVVNLLREKNALLMELHDRVKNNLQIMLSIMRMELDSVPNEENKAVIQRLRDRIWSMSLVHQEIYNVEDFSCIDFNAHVAKLIADMRDLYRCPPANIEFKNNIGECSLSIKAAMPCTMIVQEALSLMLGNNCKERKGGLIILDFESQKDRCYFSIVDDGKGLSKPYDDSIVSDISRLILQQAAHQLGGDALISFDHGLSIAVSLSKDNC